MSNLPLFFPLTLICHHFDNVNIRHLRASDSGSETMDRKSPVLCSFGPSAQCLLSNVRKQMQCRRMELANLERGLRGNKQP